MSEIYAEYERNPDAWSYPSPTRIGHLVFVAAWMKISGGRNEKAGSEVSLAFSCMSLLLVACMGVRFFNPAVALAAVAFLATSVAELGMARRVWQDSAFGFFGLLAVYLTCEITRNPRRAWLYPAFLAAGALSLLTKQTGVLSYGICALWLLGYLIFRGPVVARRNPARARRDRVDRGNGAGLGTSRRHNLDCAFGSESFAAPGRSRAQLSGILLHRTLVSVLLFPLDHGAASACAGACWRGNQLVPAALAPRNCRTRDDLR